MLNKTQTESFSKLVKQIQANEKATTLAAADGNHKATHFLTSEKKNLMLKRNQILMAAGHVEMAVAA